MNPEDYSFCLESRISSPLVSLNVREISVPLLLTSEKSIPACAVGCLFCDSDMRSLISGGRRVESTR